MGRATRGPRRAAAKEAYRKFAKNFSSTKRRQAAMSKRQRSVAEAKGEVMLGVRPTFKQWWKAVRSPTAFSAEPEDVQEHIKTLDWDDDEQ